MVNIFEYSELGELFFYVVSTRIFQRCVKYVIGQRSLNCIWMKTALSEQRGESLSRCADYSQWRELFENNKMATYTPLNWSLFPCCRNWRSPASSCSSAIIKSYFGGTTGFDLTPWPLKDSLPRVDFYFSLHDHCLVSSLFFFHSPTVVNHETCQGRLSRN